MTFKDAVLFAKNIPSHKDVQGNYSGVVEYQKVVEALAKLHTYYEMKEGANYDHLSRV